MFGSVENENYKTIFIASDHAGFELKGFLINELKKLGHTIKDLGPATYNPSDDYPDFVKKVAEEISNSQNSNSVGIVICKNGVGVCVLANKFKNVRCALSWSPNHVKSARNDDNANCLALPAGYISKETALETTLSFLKTPFSNEERHIRRLAQYGHTGNS